MASGDVYYDFVMKTDTAVIVAVTARHWQLQDEVILK